MGQKLDDIYEKAKQIGGFKAQLRLAMRTKIPAPKAKQMSDTQDNVKLFEQALEEIKKEFK